MAVVQISKIQIRRGLKNSGIGVPQLSSAEMAWAVDTQELFIGNGSVSDGAPYVGNTKILTEHDNILDLASSYRFASNDTSISLSVSRPLQSKLDEEVSVLDYGAVPDGSSDNVEAFQNALNELFRNSDAKFKKVLVVPNGRYLFTGNLSVPSTAIIRGETRDGAVLEINSNNILFVTEDGQGVAQFDSTNRPRNVNISNLTINHTSGQTVLTGLAESVFDNVKWISEYELGDEVVSITTRNSSVYWENSLPGTKVTDISFNGCLWQATPLGVRAETIVIDSSSPPLYDTFITFNDCRFFVNETGIFINGIDNQGNKWKINETKFEEIFSQALNSDGGVGTVLKGCDFINCGNGTNSANDPLYPIVLFTQSQGNVVRQSTGNRYQNANFTSFSTVDAKTDVLNASYVSYIDRNYQEIYLSDGFRALTVLSAFNRFTYVDYSLQLNNHVRYGQLVITVDETLGEISFTDNYSYSTPLVTSSGGILMTNFEFQVELKDNDSDSGIETILVSYRNPLATGATGTISFSVSYGV